MIFLILFLISFVQAQVQCAEGVFGLIRRIPLEKTPTYFIRVDTHARRIYMSGDCIVSLDTGKCISNTKTWEPYPISGKGWLTIPDCEGHDGAMCFFKSKDLESETRTKPVFTDKELKGYYQSIGFLNNNKKTSTVRVITYYGFFKDYRVSEDAIQPISSVQSFCAGKDLKLPMLSKDGKMISGWDVEKEKTFIAEINANGSCRDKFQFPYMVGKMDFSYDNRWMAFHASSDSNGKISDDLNLQQQIFVMDVKNKKTFKISSGKENIYYPHFGANGKMYALSQNRISNQYSVLEIDINKATQQSLASGYACSSCSKQQFQNLFSNNCSVLQKDEKVEVVK
ncbi:MAG: hypothetical protein H6623_06380 [Bdellovibrionaceae bacterium]|nr:hypothetical protein [Pseudobdellovibrionaceae bacterium]